MHIGLHVKYLLFLSDFNNSQFFRQIFRKIFKEKILWKSVKCEPSGRMDGHDKLIFAFRSFAKAPNKQINTILTSMTP